MENKQKIYLVVNEGNIDYATKQLDDAQDFCNSKLDIGIEEAAQECGRDIEDMTDEEIGEMSFMAGFNGNYYYVSKVQISDEMDDSEVVTAEGVDTPEEDDFEVGDIREALKASTSTDSYFDDFDDSFDGFDDLDDFDSDGSFDNFDGFDDLDDLEELDSDDSFDDLDDLDLDDSFDD